MSALPRAAFRSGAACAKRDRSADAGRDDCHKMREAITPMGMIDPPCPDTQRSGERTRGAPADGGGITRKRAFVMPRPEVRAATPPPRRAESTTSVVPPTTPPAPVGRTSAPSTAPRPRVQATPALPALPKRAAPKRAAPPASLPPRSLVPRPTPPRPSARPAPVTLASAQQAVPPRSLPPPLRPSSVVPRPDGRRAPRCNPAQEECSELRRKAPTR
jgi:hypothetical protein